MKVKDKPIRFVDDGRRLRKACFECKRLRKRCEGRIGQSCVRCSEKGIACSNPDWKAKRRGSSSALIRNSQRSGSPPSAPPNRSLFHNEPLGWSSDQEGDSGTLMKKDGNPSNDQVISRFIGDLSPEALLLAHVQYEPAMYDSFDMDHLGIWMRDQRRHGFNDWSRAIAVLARNHAQQKTNLKLPSETAYDMLIQIYFARLNPLIGLVDEPSFREAKRLGKHSVVLLLAMVLVASREANARPYLLLSDNHDETSSLIPPRAFAQRIYSQLDWLLKAGLEEDKETLIQVHGLMSLHSEGPRGNEDASLNLFTAVHYLQVLGIHLPRADETDRSGRARMLFWATWMLDKLNAAFNGRPTLIHERDMADKPMFTCKNTAECATYGGFHILIKLTCLLDKTIAMYRPNNNPPSGWEYDFPGFEQLINEHIDVLSTPCAAVLEVYYHAISILSCRSRESSQVPTPSQVRRAFSTLQLLRMTREQEFAQLPALPIVPWAVTLAMTVAYRQFRETSLTVRRCRSKSDWQSACATLGTLSDQWWTAEAMAKLGTKAVAAFEGISRRNYYWKDILAARNLNLTSSDVISHQQQGQSRVLPDSEVAIATSVRSIDREGSQDVRALAFYDNREEHSTYLQSDVSIDKGVQSRSLDNLTQTPSVMPVPDSRDFEDGFNLFDPLFLDSVPDPGLPLSFLDPIFQDISTFDLIGQTRP